MSAKIMHTIN